MDVTTSMDRHRGKSPPIREVYGAKAQWVGAALCGLYAFWLGLYLAQILCGLLGIGG